MATGGDGSQKIAPFRWLPKHRRAVPLVAADELTNEQIAHEVGVSRRALDKWRAHPEFMAEVEAYRERERQAIEKRHIADKQRRIDAAVERHRRLERIVEARATSGSVPVSEGGDTGYVVAKPLIVKVYEEAPVRPWDGGDALDDEDGQADSGGEVLNDRDYLASVKRSVIEYEYAVDTGLLKEMREIEKHVAIQLKEWSEKHEHDASEAFIQALREFGQGQGDGA